MNKNLINIKVIILVLIIVSVVIGGVFIGKSLIGSNDDTKNHNIVIKEANGIEAKAYISPGENQLIVSAINKSGKTIVSGYINVYYYDENGNKIIVVQSVGRYNIFEDGKQIVMGFELPTTDNNIDYYIPAKTEVEITIDEDYQERYATRFSEYTDKFSYSYSSNGDNGITVNLKNNGSKSEEAPISISVVFCKNKKPVYSKDVMFLWKYVEPGETISEEIDIPIDDKKSKESGEDILIDYDSIEIYRIVDSSI